MARSTFEGWIPEEKGSQVLTKISAASAMEALGASVPMNSDTKSVPRDGGVVVAVTAKGAAYTESGESNDDVVLQARKFTGLVRIAEEDIDDSVADILQAKKMGWAGSYAKTFDNATLGTTAAANGSTVPFTSVYRALTQANAATGYTANANLIQSAGDVSYDELSGALGLVEGGDYFDDGRIRVIANPTFRGTFRGIKDADGNPIFMQGLSGTPDTLFGYPVRWSVGARSTATAGAAGGNPLLVVGNFDYALVGKRSEPESFVIPGNTGASATTDETLLKLRARRGFAVGYEQAFAVLEVTSA